MSNHQPTTKRWALNANERVILCCSSTRHRRFIDDLVSVMSLPAGSRVRLRYSDTACDPAVRTLGEQATPLLAGTRALIAHVAFEAAATRFLPLRTGSVVELRTVGSVTFLEVELGDFVEGQQCIDFDCMLAPLATLKLPQQTQGEDKPSGYFCQVLESPPALSCGQDTGLWERVAKRFLASVGSSNAEFPFIFHLAFVHKRSRKPVPVREGVLIAPATSQIELHIRTLSTQSSFNSIIQAPVGTLTIAIDHPNGRLASGARHPIDTTRNLLVSRLATDISLRPAYGSVTVTARRCLSKIAAQPARAEVDVSAALPRPEPVDEVTVELPVSVGRPWTRLLAIAFISAVLAVHAFDISELTEHFGYVWGKAIALFIAAFIALLMGLKPQAGD